MDDTNFGGGSADQIGTMPEFREPWQALMGNLAAQLAQMSDDGDYLLLEMPTGHGAGCTPYAQFATFGGGTMLRAELSGNTFLAPGRQLDEAWCASLRMMGWGGNDGSEPNWFVERPVSDAGVIAAAVVGALRETFGVGHPQLLTYNAFGANSDRACELGLSATEDVPVEEALQGVHAASDSLPMMLMPSDHDELVDTVRRSLHAHLGEQPLTDRDGDFVLTHLDQTVWVRVHRDQPAVEIIARVAHGVYSRRATAAELAVLNRDHMWTIWVLSKRDIWMRLPIPALPFAPGHLGSMVDIFFSAMTETRDDLAFRVGGRVA